MNIRKKMVETVGIVGEEVLVKGWVDARRNMGKVAFLDMRDDSGILQVVVVPGELDEDSKAVVDGIRSEYVLEIRGVVQARGDRQVNADMATGTVEVLAKSVVVLNGAETTPFEVNKDTMVVAEELRLKYRYLDLRSERMHRNIIMRSKVMQFFRDKLHGDGFTEIETGILTRGTPEGAREFLVPSRLHAGEMYVLPQAPQQFKQLLMTGGIEKYFQVAKCFRDEDQRGDRQPEFTQLDLEMAFVGEEDVISLMEGLFIELVNELYPEKRIQQVPFPRLSYKESMEKYGNDRPDLREDKEDEDLLAFCWVVDFPAFEDDGDGGLTFTHNPFSAVKPEFEKDLLEKKNVEDVISAQYDIVLNGFEVGGGSIRSHKVDLLRAALEIMGNSDEEISRDFGHMLEAFSFGAPPHGGIALGMDRLMAILQGEPNIREVIAFPKDGHARDLMMGAPSVLPDSVLADVNIQVLKKKK